MANAGKGPSKSVCLLGSLFTFLRVILAPRREQGRGANMSLWLASVRCDSRAVTESKHQGGTKKKKKTHTDAQTDPIQTKQ